MKIYALHWVNDTSPSVTLDDAYPSNNNTNADMQDDDDIDLNGIQITHGNDQLIVNADADLDTLDFLQSTPDDMYQNSEQSVVHYVLNVKKKKNINEINLEKLEMDDDTYNIEIENAKKSTKIDDIVMQNDSMFIIQASPSQLCPISSAPIQISIEIASTTPTSLIITNVQSNFIV